MLNFDDALMNTYKVAFPIMEKHGLKGILFVPTIVFIKDARIRSDKAPHMNLEQAKELYEAGWEIGSHSYSHPRFDKLSLFKAEIELDKSKTHLEEWGFEPTSFAFPYGHGYYSEQQVKLAFKYYKSVRTVTNKNPQPNLIYGIPVDDYPPKNLSGTFVIHLVKNREKFERWIECLSISP